MLSSIWSKIIGTAGDTLFNLVVRPLFRKWVEDKLVPLLDTEQKRELAEALTKVADEVTDVLVQEYPDQKWDDYLDALVDDLAAVLGVD